MATRGIIAVGNNGCLGEGWRGRYAHWDNYPERIVGVLGALVSRDGYEKVVQTLIHDNVSWSTIDNDTTRFSDEMWGDDYRRNVIDGYGVVHDDMSPLDEFAWYDDECGAYSWACYVYVMTEHGVEVNTIDRIDDRDVVTPSAFYTWAEAGVVTA